jgi:sterol desaturase/sphingolipid hydroxylase (fatty acid hydroxylase superfamily)
MPPVLSVFLAAGFGLLFLTVVGKTGWILFGGFLAGYSTYLVIHYSVHALRPPENFLRFLWKHHSLHHYASVHSAFAVSMPFWDYLFGTMPADADPRRNEASRSGMGS